MSLLPDRRPAPVDPADRSVTLPSPQKPSRLGSFEVVWQFWKDYGEKVAHYQAGLLLAAIYYLVAAPTALLGRLAGHRFLPNLPSTAPTFWYDTDMGRASDPQQYLRQF